MSDARGYRIRIERSGWLPLWTARVKGYAGMDFCPGPRRTRFTKEAARLAAQRWCDRRDAAHARRREDEIYPAQRPGPNPMPAAKR